ncbi:hypothetical protein RDV64_16220 [Acuticoccus sp. MNP-M23]|uniref:hypothetical protein n=1 Tax=Acuticoccus sp. MNP-M23 TaxID=3072793 RepID=UPI002816693D|nr:hypothetical protein [Acuticoccus sp. MNP-M23]WMS41613.1 hypothetical protein RDV64_16220 [Acuticoccus sp. MNP-M23]
MAETAASIGFLVSLIATLKNKGVFVWVFHDFTSGEAGSLYGPGLYDVSRTVGQTVVVAVRTLVEMFWVMEEAIASPVVTGVSGVFHCKSSLDLKFTRRISLRSEKSSLPVYLLAIDSPQFPTSAVSHWNISHAPSQGVTSSRQWINGGNPCWKLDQIKNKKGSCRSFVLGYDPVASSLYEMQSEVNFRREAVAGAVQCKRDPWAGSALPERSAVDTVVVPFAKTMRRRVPSAERL